MGDTRRLALTQKLVRATSSTTTFAVVELFARRAGVIPSSAQSLRAVAGNGRLGRSFSQRLTLKKRNLQTQVCDKLLPRQPKLCSPAMSRICVDKLGVQH